MNKFFFLAVSGLVLSGCTATQLQASTTAFCKADIGAPALIATGGQIAVTLNPADAAAVSTLNQVDALAHPAVVAACASVGGVPASVTVAPAS